jgi:hypothetical protein
MKKKVLILGNGFDLDLGWKTGFKDFVSSEFWPLKDKTPNSPMAEHLARMVDVERWYDVEAILKEFASDNNTIYHHKALPREEVFFNELKDSLTGYLKQEETSNVKTNSLAALVLRTAIENGLFTSIYTFNYTDLRKIASRIGVNSYFYYESVHGSVGDSSIILGVDDKCNLREGYSKFLRKVFSEHYTPHHIRYDLQECNEVVFFGHSLGDIDYPYFADFFNTQSNCTSRENSKFITIFTKDNPSRIQILEQLRNMNGGHTEQLLNDNDFKLIMTDSPNEVMLNDFLAHLKKDCRKNSGPHISYL